MMGLVEVPINKDLSTIVLMDSGSNCSIITHDLANQLGLEGKFCMEMVELCGKKPELTETKYYKLKMTLPSPSVRGYNVVEE